jgi:hypothetical protein
MNPQPNPIAAKVAVVEAEGVNAIVTVDLAEQMVIYVANGVELKAKLAAPLRSITHIGFVMDSALIDVADVQIETP